LVLENNLLFPHKVVQRIADESASGFSGVPSTFALLLGRVKLGDYDLSSLRYLTQAGGPMAPALTEKLIGEIPHADLFVMYGQTEATARLSYLPPSDLSRKRGSVGIPIPGVEIEIRDKEGRPVDVGVAGEICARGENIMQGYWRDQEKTSSVVKNGWLYTGDLAHFDEDGYIYIEGRSSDMIKAGANRISPKEIEEIILELSEIQEVAVIGVPDDLLGEVIKAFIVVAKGKVLDKKQVQLHCKNNLASYKIPKYIEFIDELPKTASGKVKKYQLK
jgi:acyl-CoA synthetase (AMP-forming)/AMP-acid ligase II